MVHGFSWRSAVRKFRTCVHFREFSPLSAIIVAIIPYSFLVCLNVHVIFSYVPFLFYSKQLEYNLYGRFHRWPISFMSIIVRFPDSTLALLTNLTVLPHYPESPNIGNTGAHYSSRTNYGLRYHFQYIERGTRITIVISESHRYIPYIPPSAAGSHCL